MILKFIMFKECSSGVGTLTHGDMKKRHLISTKRKLYKNKIHGKLLKGPKMV
jgi:hypothetical protein